MSKSLHHHRKHHLHPLFTLDGNTRTFHPPQYQPLLDHHLKPFFYAHNRLKILKKNKLINGNNKVVDKTITKKFLKEELMMRPSMFQTISPKKGSYGKTAAKSVILTSMDVSGEREGKSLYESEGKFRGIALGGVERMERYQKRQGKWRATQGDGKEKANKTVSKELFHVFLDRYKDRVKESIKGFE